MVQDLMRAVHDSTTWHQLYVYNPVLNYCTLRFWTMLWTTLTIVRDPSVQQSSPQPVPTRNKINAKISVSLLYLEFWEKHLDHILCACPAGYAEVGGGAIRWNKCCLGLVRLHGQKHNVWYNCHKVLSYLVVITGPCIEDITRWHEDTSFFFESWK